MPRPAGFSWVIKPWLAASGRPDDPDELAWLREQGIDLVISLTEEPLRRDWVNEAGLMTLHVPIEDMSPPSPSQFEVCISAIQKAHERGLGVAVHCAAGLGRTGSILAGYFVAEGRSAREAIARIRELRPGSIETDEQVQAVEQFARQHAPKTPED